MYPWMYHGVLRYAYGCMCTCYPSYHGLCVLVVDLVLTVTPLLFVLDTRHDSEPQLLENGAAARAHGHGPAPANTAN